MKFGVLVFPGTWSDGDCHYAVKDVLGQEARYIWHKDEDISDVDCLIIPGGFSYGDYLRTGAIARFSPVMKEVERFAADGGLVIGICNGFQILCESGLLPGVLIRNNHVQFRCEWVNLRVETNDTPFTSSCGTGQVLSIPISHGEGNYYADDHVLDMLEKENRVVFRYCNEEGFVSHDSNPNGSLRNIAGILSSKRNILGMMPHPERCCESSLGGEDGKLIFESIVEAMRP
tara:strand:- start:124 stop:816 length:693 start_codon:yes stop_codon:yes gene_type:complete